MTTLQYIEAGGLRSWVLLAICLSTALVYIGRLREGRDLDATSWALGIGLTLLLMTVVP